MACVPTVGAEIVSYITDMISARLKGVVSDHIHLGLFVPEREVSTFAEAQEAMSLRHMMHLGTVDGETVVDVGAGFGGTLRLLDTRFVDMDLHGVNNDPRQITLARQSAFRNHVSWHCCDAAAFSDGRSCWADRILSLEALFHFPDPAGFFTAAAHALRPGGRLVVSTLLFEVQTAAAGLSRDVVTAGYQPWPFFDMGLSDLNEMAHDAGLYEVHREDLSLLCLPGLDWMSPPCPATVTANPVVELRRLFEMECIRYPLLVFDKSRQ